MAAKKTANLPPAIPVPYKTLSGLLGKPVDDPAVQAMIAKAGTVKVSSDFIVAKQAGFDYALEKPTGAKKKQLVALFLFSHGKDGHSGYADIPKPLSFSDRATLRKAKKPESGFTLDEGEVEPDHPDSERDTWTLDGYSVSAEYDDDGNTVHFYVEGSEESRGGRDISTHPLHFETKPVDAPKDAELTGMALIAAWSADRFGLPAKHEGTAEGKALLARTMSPVTFLKKACASTLTTLDVAPDLGNFLYSYNNRLFLDTRAPNREKTAVALKKILKLEDADERAYDDDFIGTFSGVVKNPFNVPDSWAAVDRMGAILDARWADFQATGMKKAPDLAMYEKAAAKRDAIKLTAAAVTVEATTIDAAQLLAMIGRPIKDVKDVLTRASLPIGKRIDEQANPATGVSYMGSNLTIDGKKQLSVTAVDFFAKGTKSYIRGIGKEVQFNAYPEAIALGISVGAKRDAVTKAFGKPNHSSDDYDYWYPDKKHRIAAEFDKGALCKIHFAIVEDYQGEPKPPFGPKIAIGKLKG